MTGRCCPALTASCSISYVSHLNVHHTIDHVNTKIFQKSYRKLKRVRVHNKHHAYDISTADFVLNSPQVCKVSPSTR